MISRTSPRLRLLVGAAVFSAAMLAEGPLSALAQTDCIEGVPLYSPSSLDVVFENVGVIGNRLTWPGVGRDLATCNRIAGNADVISRLLPAVEGLYSNIYDRAIEFRASDDGSVADPTKSTVELSLINNHPNPGAPNLTGEINLSSRGGIFRIDLDGSGVGQQVNEGIPGHLARTNIDAMARHAPTGRLFAAVQNLPIVVSDDDGAQWREPAERLRPPFKTDVRNILVSPQDPDLLWMNPRQAGLWKSTDGGATWSADGSLFLSQPNATFDMPYIGYVRVTDEGGDPGNPADLVDRLYAQVTGEGLFYSDDDGASWTKLGGLRVRQTPVVNGVRQVSCQNDPEDLVALRVIAARQVVVSPTDPSRIYVALRDWGVYTATTTSGHTDWVERNEGIVLCSGNASRSVGELRTVEQLTVVPNADESGDILVAYTNLPAVDPLNAGDERSSTNVFVSLDGGVIWEGRPLRAVVDPEEGEVPLSVSAMIPDPRASRPNGVVASTLEAGIWELDNTPQSGGWQRAAQQPLNPRVDSLIPSADGGVLAGTSEAGVYRRGLPIELDRVVALSFAETATVPRLGLTISFDGTGAIQSGESFRVVNQTFQAYAVWRARSLDPETSEPDWELIALYDLTNPESCSESPCDARDLVQIQGCFADKRSNCFFPPEGESDGAEWQFFDRDVFNGFTYWYAVSTLDYGNTANVAPDAFNGDFTFSPRSAQESDPASVLYADLAGGQNFNLVRFQVNVEIASNLDDVFVVPNPLVGRAGWDSGDASSVRFVNVTPTSRVEIYTLAGDLIQELDNVVFDGTERGNIEWDTRNAEGQQVSSGVYIFRITDDEGGEVISRFTVIR